MSSTASGTVSCSSSATHRRTRALGTSDTTTRAAAGCTRTARPNQETAATRPPFAFTSGSSRLSRTRRGRPRRRLMCSSFPHLPMWTRCTIRSTAPVTSRRRLMRGLHRSTAATLSATFFANMTNASDKPVLLTEYGVDAYHDVCGEAADTGPCFNTFDDHSDSFEDQTSQAEFAGNLTNEIRKVSSAKAVCAGARRGSKECVALGGFLMSWVDEFWKGAKSQAGCAPTYSSPLFSVAKCDPRAHVTCGNWNASQHDLCGYWLEAAPDHYVNEEWFGITSPTGCGNSVNHLRVREIFWRMRKLWANKPFDAALFPASCETMLQQSCAFAPAGGDLASDIFAASGGTQRRKGREVACSGRGVCTTSWEVCGAGNANRTATPCCTCQLGFAGDGCEQLDARIYVLLGAFAVLTLLLLLMLSTWATKAVVHSCSATKKSGYRQPLMK
mmetsp:Transcript_60054/g.137669  ORF Transcript_60054/g.137669 Transcript_60054/m.137669 type:complete len:444 (+) Transcript_60054:465-1796(+)